LPHVKQHVITTPTGEAALRGHRAIYQTILFDKRKKGLSGFRDVMGKCRWMRRHETVLLLPHRSIRSSLLASYLSYPSVGYYESPLGLLNTRRVARVSPLHEASRIGLLLEPL